MRKLRWGSLCLFGVIILFIVVIRCSFKTANNDTMRDDDKRLLASSPPPSGVYCTVNGAVIMEDELDSVIQRGFTGFPPGALPSGELLARERKRVVELFIDLVLLRQLAEESGILFTTDGLANSFDADMARRAQSADMPVDAYIADVEMTTGIPYEQMKSEAIADPLYQRQILRDQLIRLYCDQQKNISDDEIREYYETNRARRFQRPESVQFSRILFLTVDTLTGQPKSEEEQSKAQARAEAVLQKLQSHPDTDFAELAKQYSECVSGQFGGDQGIFYRDENRGGEPDDLAEAAFELNENETSNVVKSRLGYNILKVIRREPPVNILIEEAWDTIHDDILAKRASDIRQALHPETLRKKAVVLFEKDK